MLRSAGPGEGTGGGCYGNLAKDHVTCSRVCTPWHASPQTLVTIVSPSAESVLHPLCKCLPGDQKDVKKRPDDDGRNDGPRKLSIKKRLLSVSLSNSNATGEGVASRCPRVQ